MISVVSNVTQTQPAVQASGPSKQKAVAPEAKAASTTDSAQLSQTAEAMLAALKEATETSTQTAKEAGSGDMQAARLLAKEAAAESASK